MGVTENIARLLSIGITVKSSPSQQKVKCPQCSDKRNDKRDKSLSVNVDSGLFRCHYCGYTGSVNDKKDEKYKIPEPSPNGSDKLPEIVVDFFSKRRISRETLRKAKISHEEKWIAKLDKKTDVAVFNYYEGGYLKNKKYRSIKEKGFSLEAGAKLIFYNIDAIIGHESVIITEGEIDCLSFMEAGIENVISVPNGANVGQNNLQYLDNCINYFNGVKRIYLAVDNDDPGISLRDELARRLGKDICYIVRYPEGCKDANDVLMKYDEKYLSTLISNAEPFPIEGIVYADSEMDSILALYNSGYERGVELKEFGDQFDRMCTFQTSRLYVFTGIPGHGKSTLLENIEVILAAKKGWKFGIFSPEHHPLAYMIYKYAELIVGKPFFKGDTQRMTVQELEKAVQFIKEHFFFIRPKDDMFTLDEILSISKSLIKKYGVKSIVVDPWNTINHSFEGESETQYIEKALNKITLFKQEYDVMFVVVAHPKKMVKAKDGANAGLYEVPNLYDISGSSNFFNKADVGICVYRDFKQDCTFLYVQKMKYRNLGEVDNCKFKFNKVNNRYSILDEFNQYKPNNKNILSNEVEQTEIKLLTVKSSSFESEAEDYDDLPF